MSPRRLRGNRKKRRKEREATGGLLSPTRRCRGNRRRQELRNESDHRQRRRSKDVDIQEEKPRPRKKKLPREVFLVLVSALIFSLK